MAASTSNRSKLSKGLPLLFWLSLLYLVTELAFAAQLLELAGSRINEDQLHRIELVGRSLSGIAIALFIFGWLAKRRWPKALKRLLVPVILALTIGIVWLVQEAIIETAVFEMRGTKQQRAVILVRATDLIREGHIRIAALDLSAEVLKSPTGLSFMAMFPMLALGSETIEAEIEPLLDNAVKRALILDCDGTVETLLSIPCLGKPADFADQHWPVIAERLRAAYDEYDAARRPILAPTADEIDQAHDEAWRDYRRRLSRRGLSSNTRHHRRVRSELRRAGLDVPNDWALDDRDGMRPAVISRYRQQALERWDEEQLEGYGEVRLPHDLTPSVFFNNMAARERIWTEWGVAKERVESHPPPAIDPGTSAADLQAVVHGPLLNYIAEFERDSLLRGQTTLANEYWYERARTASRWTVIPPLALAFSVLGALAHVIKVAGYILALLMPRRLAIALPTIAVITGSVWVYHEPNPIIDSPAFATLSAATAAQFGRAVSVPIHYTIQAERHLYPVGSAIRRYGMFNIDFTAW
ncbi:MAG: hypothetical protein AAF556_02405 [Pseudomonadota bacterium]